MATIAHSPYINVPVVALQEVREDSLQFSMLALSVAVKCLSPSSVYLCRSVSHFRQTFHCGKQKAERLLQALQQSTLFCVCPLANGTLRITARSLKRMYGTMACYRGYRSLQMNAVKATCLCPDNLRITQIERQLRQLLLTNAYHTQMRCDELTMNPRKANTHPHAHRELSVKALASITGRCARTVLRYNQQLRQQGELRITTHPLVRVCCDMERATPAQRAGLIAIRNLGFTRQCNDYELLRRETFHRSQHIIFSHRRRLTHHFAARAAASTPEAAATLRSWGDMLLEYECNAKY